MQSCYDFEANFEYSSIISAPLSDILKSNILGSLEGLSAKQTKHAVTWTIVFRLFQRVKYLLYFRSSSSYNVKFSSILAPNIFGRSAMCHPLWLLWDYRAMLWRAIVAEIFWANEEECLTRCEPEDLEYSIESLRMKM